MEFETAYDMLGSVIGEEVRRLDILLTSDRLTRTDKKNLNGLMEENFEKPVNLHRSLRPADVSLECAFCNRVFDGCR